MRDKHNPVFLVQHSSTKLVKLFFICGPFPSFNFSGTGVDITWQKSWRSFVLFSLCQICNYFWVILSFWNNLFFMVQVRREAKYKISRKTILENGSTWFFVLTFCYPNNICIFHLRASAHSSHVSSHSEKERRRVQLGWCVHLSRRSGPLALFPSLVRPWSRLSTWGTHFSVFLSAAGGLLRGSWSSALTFSL